MRIRSLGLAALVGTAVIVAACSTGGTAGGPSPTPDPCAGAAKHSGDARTLPTDTSQIKIGVGTDVGKVDDKNFNEYTYAGAQEAATTLGIAGEVPFVTPASAADRIPNIQKFVDEGFHIIVTAGFANGTATGCVAKANPDVWFIGVDQGPPAAGAELPNYIQLSYQEDQAGYLAGMVAAVRSGEREKWIAQNFLEGYPRNVDDEALISDFVGRYVSQLMRLAYQCQHCGRLLLEDLDNEAHFRFFQPEHEKRPDILRSRSRDVP